MRITIRSGEREFTVNCAAGEDLLTVLQSAGLNVPAGCGGRGVCGKCKVYVCGGSFGAEEREALACRTEAEEGLTVRVGEYVGGGLTEGGREDAAGGCDGEEGFGLAVDIGTTTVAYALCDLRSGKTLKKHAELNRQASFGADVISRIMSAEAGNAQLLAEAVRGQIAETAARLMSEFSVPVLKKVTVCGNTTMLHLFCGEDVSGIGRYPFTPAFTEFRSMPGGALGLAMAEEVQLLPSVSAYVGADIVAGAIAAGLDNEDALLVDIGTNGEMLAHSGGRFFCTSTAAGPCFEGANIECGTGGVAGAVDSVRTEDGKVAFTTIGGEPPRGICGAGLVDALAVMLGTGAIDETGAFVEGDKFVIGGGVYISQKDVRNYQLAKSAICAGIRILAERAGLALAEKNLYIAGGLGFYLDGANARKTGLLPAEGAERQKVIGNAALAGARLCMISRAALERAKKLAAETEYIDLSADAEFMDAYIENMNF